MPTAASPLATWIVEFDGTATAKAIDDLGLRVKALAETFTISLGVYGLFRAGLAQTGDMERLSFLVQQVSREFASVFLPIIRSVQVALQQLLGWFRSLSGEGQALVRNIVLTAIAFKVLDAAIAASSMFGFVTSLIVIVTTVRQLGNALGLILGPFRFLFDFFANSGIGTFILQVVVLTKAIFTLGYAIETLKFKMVGVFPVLPGWFIAAAIAIGLAALVNFFRKPEERQQVGGGGAGGPEDMEQTWFRIQRNILNTDIAVAQLRALEQIAANTARPFQVSNQTTLALT